MASPLKDSVAFGTFLDTYNRLTAGDTQRDSASVVFDVLSSHGKMKLDDLIDRTRVDSKTLFATLSKLEGLQAIALTGTGFDQEVEITDKGHDLMGLLKS